ncbi:mitochondrial carrier domain-containing protein [Gorgonomyces haynaldii]|nr:mitochondrial carrier domain-containing protein [Gorgonomyces haynaldii]
MDREGFIHTFAGFSAGIVSAITVNPLDIVKFRLQNQQSKSIGIKESLKIIYRQEGFRGFYRGLTATVQVYAIDRALWFPAYHELKRTFASLLDTQIDTFWVHLSASCVSSSLVHSNQNGIPLFQYKNVADGLKTMIRQEGFVSLYKGLLPSFLGISHVAVQFPMYEQLKLLIRHQFNSIDLLLASSISKFIASAVTYPHEVVRTRLQTQIGFTTIKYKGLLRTLGVIITEEGLSGLYKGLGANLIRTVPAAAISIYTYELLVRMLS